MPKIWLSIISFFSRINDSKSTGAQGCKVFIKFVTSWQDKSSNTAILPPLCLYSSAYARRKQNGLITEILCVYF